MLVYPWVYTALKNELSLAICQLQNSILAARCPCKLWDNTSPVHSSVCWSNEQLFFLPNANGDCHLSSHLSPLFLCGGRGTGGGVFQLSFTIIIIVGVLLLFFVKLCLENSFPVSSNHVYVLLLVGIGTEFIHPLLQAF